MPQLSESVDPQAAARFAADASTVDPDDALLAVSGGADSLAMMLLARAAWGQRSAVATVDHGLNPQAPLWARSVAGWAETLGLSHAVLCPEVVPGGQGMQAAARHARYAALVAHARAIGRGVILTAHHADDQAETLLMRLRRGSGLAGLSGIRAWRAVDGVAVVRPLLGWRRSELAAIVADAGGSPVDDPANRDLRHDRTNVRRLLEGADPLRLACSASHLAEAEAALVWTTSRTAAERVRRDAAGWALDPDGLPAEIVRRLLLLILAEAGGGTVGGPAVDRLRRCLMAGESATLGPLLARPGSDWRFTAAPPRRAGDKPKPAIVH